MSKLTSLPPEILCLIFAAIQNASSCPRYVLNPLRIDAILAEVKDQPKDVENSNPEEDSRPHASWTLKDGGPLSLASTCKSLRSIYFSRAVASNLILEIPDANQGDYFEREHFYDFWDDKESNGNLLARLRQLKDRLRERGKSLTRFRLDSKWDAWDYNVKCLNMEVWAGILRNVSEVFGDELTVVICCQGRSFGGGSMPNSTIGNSKSAKTSKITTPRVSTLRTPRAPIPRPHPKPQPLPEPPARSDLSNSSPLSLHLYFGVKQHRADILMGCALSMFASKNLQSLYYSSDPGNLHLVGNGRRPATGHELYEIRDPYFLGNPWRHLLPSKSSACETLENITLDCSLFWSELAFCLSHLYRLKHLDCELALLHTEHIYPNSLERKEEAGGRILETCLNSEEVTKKERGLKKNKDKRWIDIKKEGIVLPKVEPEVLIMPDLASSSPLSRFSTVDMKVCLQVGKKRIMRSKKGEILVAYVTSAKALIVWNALFNPKIPFYRKPMITQRAVMISTADNKL
ncbi:hypothetical protein G7Y89_g7195 [Cudoniella acicularis]|uniref:Uncharacterized protein n=1 Tax=Cudoniella acicularis TaxID=354080 RepID=A0A8H4W267_9HELO|nr:hypothetical protein G7Y89_g7195 [Cudoniella acicularis]